MDYGSLTGSRFTVFDNTVAEDPQRTAQLLNITHAKLAIAKSIKTQIREQLRGLEDVYHASLGFGKASSRAAMIPRLTSMLAQAHLLDRYILLVARDCLLYESCLRGPVPDSYWQNWRTSTLDLANRAPNIHDYFLWRITLEDEELDISQDEENLDEHRVPDNGRLRLALRRDAQ